MRHLLLALCLLLPAAPSQAQISIGIGIELPGISIGINLPAYPAMVRVPGYPVYYAPRLNLNFFFYDGLYWVYSDDRWYASDWYNGPWWEVEPAYMPLFVLRVPIRYYRRPPMHFRYWRADRAPRWDEHWGQDWSRQHRDWDRWDRRAAPPPAPLPDYQRQFPERNYPSATEQRQDIREQYYRYQPREAVTQQHFQQRNSPSQQRIEPQRRPDVRQSPGRQAPENDEQRRPAPNRSRNEAQPQRPDTWQAPGRQPQREMPRQPAPNQPRIVPQQQRPDMQRQPQGGADYLRTEPRRPHPEGAPQQRQPSRGTPPSGDELLLERQQQRDRDRYN
ncbi:hypothetical protein PQU96_06060 [Vogesella sp. LYT5W]|uniref:DUF3300 domain-containing protein n=1 Tax=Vogesella margarita TaxID=2984199 RepID=A0ABT5IMF2_9NEIS|nr:hypothetical protein [Vogesella margarita]MDC7713702.1 hypothetical protein [Vogesella margarita]